MSLYEAFKEDIRIWCDYYDLHYDSGEICCECAPCDVEDRKIELLAARLIWRYAQIERDRAGGE